MLGSLLGIALALLTTAGRAQADSSGAAEPCFDTLVSARVVRQIPSVVPEPAANDMIIMSWPYFIDLDIVRVLHGTAPLGRSTMLSVQHTYWRKGLGVRKWWLRRNSLGGFNILLEKNNETLARCAATAPPADPYISPGEGRTLEDMMREGREANGQRP